MKAQLPNPQSILQQQTNEGTKPWILAEIQLVLWSRLQTQQPLFRYRSIILDISAFFLKCYSKRPPSRLEFSRRRPQDWIHSPWQGWEQGHLQVSSESKRWARCFLWLSKEGARPQARLFCMPPCSTTTASFALGFGDADGSISSYRRGQDGWVM